MVRLNFLDDIGDAFKGVFKGVGAGGTIAAKGVRQADDVFKTAADRAALIADPGAAAAKNAKKNKKPADLVADASTNTKKALGNNLDDIKKVDLDNPANKTVFEKLKTNVTNSKEFLSRNKKLLSGLAIATAITGIAIAADAEVKRINNTVYKITSIKSDTTNSKFTIVTFDPPEKFHPDDVITLSETNSTPNVDGIVKFEIINDSQILINTSITQPGNAGTLRCRTNFGNRFSKITEEVVSPILEVGTGVLGGILDALGLGGLANFFTNYWWISLIIIILSISSSAALFIYNS